MQRFDYAALNNKLKLAYDSWIFAGCCTCTLMCGWSYWDDYLNRCLASLLLHSGPKVGNPEIIFCVLLRHISHTPAQ